MRADSGTRYARRDDASRSTPGLDEAPSDPGASVAGRTRPRVSRRDAPRRAREWLRPVLGIGTILLVLVVWQVAAATRLVDPAFSSEPTAIVVATYDYVTSSEFVTDARYSGLSFVVGEIIAIAVGVLLGGAMGWFAWLRDALDYIVSAVYAAPRIALVPLLVLWFGIGFRTEVAVIVLTAVFPVLVNTIMGVRTVDAERLELGRSLKMTRVQLFRYILMPSAFPSVLAGIRLAIGLGLIGLVVSEFLAATEGIGYSIRQAADLYQADKLFAGLLIICVIGLAATGLVKFAEKRVQNRRS